MDCRFLGSYAQSDQRKGSESVHMHCLACWKPKSICKLTNRSKRGYEVSRMTVSGWPLFNCIPFSHTVHKHGVLNSSMHCHLAS